MLLNSIFLEPTSALLLLTVNSSLKLATGASNENSFASSSEVDVPSLPVPFIFNPLRLSMPKNLSWSSWS